MRGRHPGDLRAREWGLAPAHSSGTLRVLGAGTILGGKIFFFCLYILLGEVAST